jgi:hypothetical protein
LPRVKTQDLSGSGGGGSLSSVVHFFMAPLWTPPSSLSLSLLVVVCRLLQGCLLQANSALGLAHLSTGCS